MRRLPSVLAAALAATSLLPATVAPAQAAGGKAIRGKATFYELQSGGGNCSYPSPPADNLYVALSPREYAAAAACGGYLNVTGPRGTVRVKVVDQCPECPAGHIDLSRTAFARVADPGKGMAGVTYRPVGNPRVGRPLSFRVKEGSSQWWLALLVVDHGNPLASVEVKAAGGAWRKLARADYNYWIAESGMGRGPFAVRVTDTRGHRVTVKRVRLAPAVIQRTTTRMY
ncbi:expansin EXLX1 family cellulose-binding protein [Nonomuraea sp. SYSU D8015]|uniref:expansin EXLX1 family cellulose-binding protein n=1 Tax=Nonomuraea sp. SYSU D8015 TaxID=2593644 RepID=UPI001CB6D137|nr:expansin EXLX1 family cellulose-binding protein [Nonomuraea sp. SYSU D8015]